MIGGRRPAALGLAILVVLAAPVLAEGPPTVTGVDIVSPHELPEARVRTAIGLLTGRPRLRGLVRDSLDRLWALGLLESARVEEVAEPGGVRLRFLLSRQPWVRQVHVRGDVGLDMAEVVAAAGLARGGSAGPERLERARRDLLALYEREGFFGADVRVETDVDAGTAGRDVTLVVDAGDRARVRRVRVRGAERLGRDAVLEAFDVDAGARYRASAVRDGLEAVERLYRERGFFEARVRVDRTRLDAERDVVELQLSVEEGPHTRVEFTGGEAVGEKTLRERLTFADTRIVDETELQASTRQLEALYGERGHAFARVTASLAAADGDRVVRFAIEEGPRVEVESVEFTGSPVPEARLRERIETRPPGLLRPGHLRRDVVARDAQSLAVFLRTLGYPEASVGTPRIEFSEDRRRARVRFPIDAGPRVLVGRVSVSGARVFTEEELLGALPLEPGDPWVQARAEEGRRLLERRYARRGFHAPEVAVIPQPRDGVMDLTYRIVEGPQTRIGRILIRGLLETRESVVRRQLEVAPGDPLNPEELVEAQRRLAELGIFDRVDVEPLRPPPAPFADVIVTVRERKPWRVDFGAGYSTYEGIRGSLELGRDNLFGTARSFTLRGRLSERGDRTDLVYVEPWVLGTRWRGDVNLFRERRDEIGFEFERYGIAVGIGRELAPEIPVHGLRAALRYELSHVDRFDIDPTLVTADVQPGAERISTITPELTLDRRDQPFDPHRGSFHLLSVRTGGVFLGGDADFVKSRLETHWFLDWIPPTVLAVSARLGLAAPLLDDDTLPIEERFFAGGATTVRGYREQRLGPLDSRGNPTGGNAQLIFNVEWRFPIWRWFGGAVFFDTGTVVSEIGELDLDQLRSGVGVGLRASTPVGPLRLDVGYPLDRIEREDQELRVYVTVGYPF
jgi:outer membrane protein insertion porin family